MKTIKFIAFLFYKYYSKGATSDIPYVSTLCAMGLLLYLHLVQFLAIFNALNLIPGNSSDTRVVEYFKIALFMTPLFLIIMIFIKKSELKSMQCEKHKIKKGYIFLIIYIILSFSLTMFLALIQKGKFSCT